MLIAPSASPSQSYYRVSPISSNSNILRQPQYPGIIDTMQNNMQAQNMSQPHPATYATGGPVQSLQYHQQPIQQPAQVPVRASSGAWTPTDDATLMNARAQGLNWQPIQATYFPNKTPNACRKRHERLMERRNSDDWDVMKLENMAKEYINMRRDLWAPLSAKTGEKWTVVEAKCMSSGIKNLQSAARACARRERLDASSHGGGSGSGSSLMPVQDPHGHSTYGDPSHTDDSGIGLDELDAEYSADTGSYGGPGSLSPDDDHTRHTTHNGGPVKIYPNPVSNGRVGAYDARAGGYDNRGGGGYQPQHTMQMADTRGPEGRYMQQQQQQQQQHFHGLHSPPRYNLQRLPSIDMGIPSIINRSGTHGPNLNNGV